jgi:hypothetical protein
MGRGRLYPNRRVRLLVGAGAIVAALVSGVVAYADTISADGDLAKANNRLAYTNANFQEQCSARGTAALGAITVKHNGMKHFDPGATVTATVTPDPTAAAAGITATGGSAVVPADWNVPADSNTTEQTFTIGISTLVPVSAPNRPDPGYTVDVEVSGPAHDGHGDPETLHSLDSYEVWVTCPAPVTDTTPPQISFAVTPAPNANGWNNSAPVALAWTVVDPESTVAIDSGCVDEQFSSETSGATRTCSAHSAGGSAGPVSATVKLDTTSPVVALTGVVDGATYNPLSVPVAGCTTSDALSGVATSASLSQSGGPLGSITATCSGATDNAGNSGSATATYNVNYSWNGFFQPIDNLPTQNTVKAGSAVPVKFSLGGNQGLTIFAAGYPTSNVAACAAAAGDDQVESTVEAGNSSLAYDATTNQYTYVWKTDKAWAGTCRQLRVKLNDGTLAHAANFKFTK